ncbi:MAG: hypothetical protein KC492_24390, partial [Myxococcales bacterium]|nr:hypothetical protein [Myxococcales bacterium]
MTLIVLVVVGLLGAAVTPSLTRGWTLAEQRVAYWSLGAHLLSAPAQEIVYRKFYGGGDMFHYAMFGELLTELIWIDPSTALPGVFRLLVQQEHRLPMWVLGQGTSTGSMSAVSGLLGIFVGSSLTAQGAVIGVVSYSGKCACYSVFRVGLDARSRFLLAVGQLLVPTAVFWSAALLKEPMIAGAFGWLIYALGQLIERRRTGALLIAAACTVWIGLFKPYLLVGVAAGFGAWV